ncbi:MAG: hypothetical protein E7439_03340 [Ruminococcaceae bacterium]|nr:hypothetical protein [Oscillospiraceae bacterium]
MIRVYADETLIYDSRQEELELSSLKVTTALNLGGTAEFILPPGHPAYYTFVGQRTIVTIYRDGTLRFRGRVLYYSDNSYGQRTVVCEGELCLLRDGISRPYLYQDTPAKIFTAVIQSYNSQVEDFKKFQIGEITVTDSNDYVRLESESAETVLDTINKLLERCGGNLVFTDTGDSQGRIINWLAKIDRQSNQVLEFGENLLDFSSTGANTTSLATGIIPYGARLEEKDADGKTTLSKKRLTIKEVNGGKDYIIAEDARAIRGTIMTTAIWDDVTEPENLLKKAQALLNERKNFITSLELTGLDLSYLKKELDSFTVGDNIRVISNPHNVDAIFQLYKMIEDLLNPAKSKITLGKDVPSLSGATVLGDAKGYHEVEALRVGYSYDIQQFASTVETNVLDKTAALYVSPDGVVQLLVPLDDAIVEEGTTRAQADQGLQQQINNYDELIGLLFQKLREQEETLTELTTKIKELEGNT